MLNKKVFIKAFKELKSSVGLFQRVGARAVNARSPQFLRLALLTFRVRAVDCLVLRTATLLSRCATIYTPVCESQQFKHHPLVDW